MTKKESENVYHEQYKKINIDRDVWIPVVCHD